MSQLLRLFIFDAHIFILNVEVSVAFVTQKQKIENHFVMSQLFAFVANLRFLKFVWPSTVVINCLYVANF